MSIISSDLPCGWEPISLGELMAKTPGVVPANDPKTEFELWSVPAYDLGMPEIQTGAQIGSNKQVVQPGDVLLCKINPRINRVWRVGNAVGLPQIASTEWIVLRSECVDSRFLMHRLRERALREMLTSNVSGVGGSLTRVRPQVVADIEISLPPLREQRRIADQIEALQARSRATREALEAIPPLLEQFRQSVLAAAFRGDLTADWRAQNSDVEPGSVLLERIRADRRRQWESNERERMQSKGKVPHSGWKERYQEPIPLDTAGLPSLPAGWVWMAIDEIATDARVGLVRAAADQSDSEGVPYVRMQHYNAAGRWNLEDLTFVQVTQKEFSLYELEPGDVLFNTRNSVELVGKTAVWSDDFEPAVYNNNLLRLRFAPGVSSHFVGLQMQGPFFQNRVSSSKSATTSVAAIYQRELLRQPVAVAPIGEQQQVAALLNSTLMRLAKLENLVGEHLHSLEDIDQSILAKAFRGELVPQNPNDEPASVLLERVQAEREAAGGEKKRRRRAAAR